MTLLFPWTPGVKRDAGCRETDCQPRASCGVAGDDVAGVVHAEVDATDADGDEESDSADDGGGAPSSCAPREVKQHVRQHPEADGGRQCMATRKAERIEPQLAERRAVAMDDVL